VVRIIQRHTYKEGHYQGGECFFPSLNFSDGNFVSLREFHVLYLIIAKDLIRGGKDRSHNIRQEILTPENIGSTITCVPEKVMNIGETLYVTNRENWREWLVKNFDKEKEIWLVFPHKSSSKSRISYNDAFEEALCFGWIDSIVKKHDHESSVQRFSPKNPKIPFSQPNKERLRLLLNETNRITKINTAVFFIFPLRPGFSLFALQPSQPLSCIFNLSYTRVCILPQIEELFIIFYECYGHFLLREIHSLYQLLKTRLRSEWVHGRIHFQITDLPSVLLLSPL
jgi:hypothetical protein